jgi:hypothetical protein
MNNLFNIKYYLIALACLLITSNLFAFDVYKKHYLHSGSQFIATIYTTKDGGDKALDKFKTFVHSIFTKAKLKAKKTNHALINISENKFFFGKDGKIINIFKFADFPLKAQINLAQKFCNDIDCDLIYQGEYLEAYSLNSRDFEISNKTIFVKKEDIEFFVKSNAPKSLKKAIIENHDGDLIYSGTKGKINYYKKGYFSPKEKIYLVYMHKGQQKIPLYTSFIEKKGLNVILNLTNAECISSNKKGVLTSCKNSPLNNHDAKKPVKAIYAKFDSGELKLSTQKQLTHELFERLNNELKPLATTTDGSTRIAQKKTIKLYKHSSQMLNNITIKYYSAREVVATSTLTHLDKEARASIHDFIVLEYAPTSYQVYRPSVNGDLLISEHNLSKNNRFNKFVSSTTYKKYLEIGLNFKSNTNSVDAPYAIRYLSRSELPSFATAAISAIYWPFRVPVGFSTDLNYYSIVHESVDLSGNVTKYNGINLDYNFLTHFKYLFRNTKNTSELEFALGVEKKNYTVDTNDSIGNLGTFTGILKVQYNTWFQKFKASAALKIGSLINFEQTFTGVSDFDDTTGFLTGVEVKISKKIDKKSFAHLGMNYSKYALSLDWKSVTINDMAFYLGVSYRWGEL